MKSSKSTLWILITTIIIINLCQVNQAIKPGLKDNSTLSKKIIKRRLSQDQLFEDLNDDSGSDGTSFYFLPAKTIRGNTRYGYMQDSVDSNGGDISYLESDEEIKSSSAPRSGSILPNGRPGRMRVRRVEQSPSLLPSADHLIESNSEYKFDDFIVPNSSSSAKRNYNSSSASLLASPSSASSASSASPYEANHGSRSTSFGSRRRIKIKEIQSDPNMEPRSDPISHFMEVDMKENEEGKELLDPGSSEIRDTIEPRSPHFKQNFRNSDSLDSVNSFSRFKSNSEDFEGTLPRPQSSLLSGSDSNANNGQSNPQYRPNYEHYESRGGSPSRNRETLGLESGFTGIVPGSSSGLSSSSSSSSRQLHPSLIRSTENSDSVRGNRARYFRPQTVGDYRQSNHAYINAARPPTILIPNQDIRQQLPRPYFVTTLPPTLTSSLPYTTYSDLSMVGLSHYQSGNSEFESRPQSHRNSQTGRRPSSHYRTMIADHLVDEDEPVGYNGRGLTTASPLPSQPTSRPTRGTTSTTSTTRASTELTRTRPISRDYHYNYDGDRQRQPNYDYPDQPTTRLNNPNPRLNNRHSNDRSHRNQFYSQATATTTSTTTTTTTPRPSHRYQHNNNDDNNFDRTNDRGQPQNYRNDYDSPGQTGTVAPTSESDQPNQSDPGPRPFRIRPAGRPGGGRRRRKRPRNPLGSNQAAGPANRPSTTTTTTTTTTTAPPPAPYYYDDYDDNDDYEYDYPTTTTTTHRPRRKGRRGQGGRRQRTSTTPSTTTTTTPVPTTKTLSPNYKPRPDNRIIDYMVDPNFPHELKGADLTDYPFYISLPTEIHFNCEGRHDGYYASIEHKCQVYHHCALGHRYDFLCPNYTLFDQTTFTCRFVNTVDCLKSENHFNRNDDLYAVTTDKPEDGGKSSKNEKERSKRDDKEAIKTEASLINKQTSSDLNNNFNNSSNSDSFKKEIIAKLELNGEKSNNSDNLNNKTKVRNKETNKDESYKT